MWVYWILFVLPALAALHYLQTNERPSNTFLLIFVCLMTAIVGLRYQVGVDWGNYIGHYELAKDATVFEAITTNDAGFGFLNWIVGWMGIGVWLVNVVCAVIFSAGIFALARRTPHPWLALAVSVPQMVIVVGMGYNRQSAAIGCVCLAIVAAEDLRVRRGAFLVLLGAMFHRTAIIMLCMAALGTDPKRWGISKVVGRLWRATWVAGGCFAGYFVFLSESRENLAETYLETRMISDGTYPRVMMNVTAAIAYLVMIRPRQMKSFSRTFWTSYSWTALPFAIAIIFLPPLTAIDRIALYWMPLQIYACAHLPTALSRRGMQEAVGILILCAYGVTQFVWFTFANFSWAWKPYQFYPIEVWINGGTP